MRYVALSHWKHPGNKETLRVLRAMKDALHLDNPLELEKPPMIDNKPYHLGDTTNGISYWAFWYIGDGPSYRFELRTQEDSLDMPIEIVDNLYKHLFNHRGWILSRIHL